MSPLPHFPPSPSEMISFLNFMLIILLVFFFKNLFIYLLLFFWLRRVLVVACGIFIVACVLLSCGMRVGSSSPTRDRTWAPCIVSVESYPLDHQGSPSFGFLYSFCHT